MSAEAAGSLIGREWSRTTVGELCDAGIAELTTGPFGSQLHAHDYVDAGVPVVPTEAIRNRRIDHSLLPKISTDKAAELQRHRLRPGDILFARRGVQATGHIGCVRQAEDGFICGTGAIRLRIREQGNGISADFLSHVLADPASVTWFKFHAIGATMPNLNEGIIRSFPFALPSLAEQQAIAEALSAVDDKIELNRRLSETLESIAHALFKSWFVDFEPTRAKSLGHAPDIPRPFSEMSPGGFEDSEMGPIPTGWLVSSLNDAVEVNPPRPLKHGTLAPYLDMANMPTVGHSPSGLISRASGSGARFANGDTLVARITPCLENGKTAFVDFLKERQVAWGSTEYIVLRPRPPLPPEYAYCLARSPEFRDFAIQSMTGSSGRQRVSVDSFSHFKLAVPPSNVALHFGQLVSPLFARSREAHEESATLASLRDTLLPKLVSGQLRTAGPNSGEFGLPHGER